MFDPRWKPRVGESIPPHVVTARRSSAYAWLASAMGLPVEECHIGMFDYNRCRQAMTVIANSGSPTTAVKTSTDVAT